MQMLYAKIRFPFIVIYVFFPPQKISREGETIQNLLVAGFLGKQYSVLCVYYNQ